MKLAFINLMNCFTIIKHLVSSAHDMDANPCKTRSKETNWKPLSEEWNKINTDTPRIL